MHQLRGKGLAFIFTAGVIFNALTLFLAGYKSGIITFVSLNGNRWDFFYLAYFLSFVALLGTLLFFQDRLTWKNWLGLAAAVFFPTQALLLAAIEKKAELHPYFGIATAAYAALVVLFLMLPKDAGSPDMKNDPKSTTGKSWLIFLVIAAVMAIHLFFGIRDIGKMAIVDEPLWTFDRIPDFWKNIASQDWYGSRVSDKPGLTTAAVSGIGLLFEEYPKQFKNTDWSGESFAANMERMERFNAAFRLPIFLLGALLLPLFYFFLKKLFGRRTALFSFVFIALSPILLGNSRIINPDSSLWIFTSFSLLAYLIHLKDRSKKYLCLAALFLTLSLLTKYVANFLYIFFFGMIFAEFIFNREKYSALTFGQYLKKTLADYGTLVLISLLLFYVLYPACWAKPSRVLIGTIYSQAFEPVWPFFSSILAVVLADLFLFRARLFSAIADFLSRKTAFIYKAILAIFILSVLVSSLNVYTGMGLFDAEKILSSPKSSSKIAGLTDIYLANFYPLIFGISPLALIPLIIFGCRELFRKVRSRHFFPITAIIIFILLYYSGSVANQVSLTIRYQIILYPLILILAGIATAGLLSPKKIIFGRVGASSLGLSAAIILLTASIANSSPFFMGYASELLPKRYSIDLKGMGEGSYEAAQYLNSLPNARNLSVWSDKKGVCAFFAGSCSTSMEKKFFSQKKIDYFVASSDRATRTTNMLASKVAELFDLNALYYRDDLDQKTILIGGRKSNFIKITPSGKIAR